MTEVSRLLVCHTGDTHGGPSHLRVDEMISGINVIELYYQFLAHAEHS